MSWDSRVAWTEGLFLRPQHFQQQERFLERFIEGRTSALRPYSWGVTSLDLDRDLAAQGKFAVRRCSGVMPDGTPFDWPSDAPSPAPLDLPENLTNAVVFLTLPAKQQGVAEFSLGEKNAAAARFKVGETEVRDSCGDDDAKELIEIGRLSLGFGTTRDQVEGRIRIPIARVIEMRDRQVVFDDVFVPTCLDIAASSVLSGWLDDIAGRAESRVDELAERSAESADGGAETFASFLLLQALNRWLPVLEHLRVCRTVHPERLYEVFLSMSGELSTFTRAERKPPKFPRYDHEDLKTCFEPVFRYLQSALSAMFDRSAVQLELQELGYGAYQSPIRDRNLYSQAAFFLAVSARIPLDEIRGRFAALAKVGAAQRMPEIVRNALPGVPLKPVTTPPSQLRVLPDFVYFELDRSSPDWKEFATAPSLGLQVAGEWPALRLELWAVKRR
jgi:type VI secretion system protein ImpJ